MKVVVTGPESSGKTTLSLALAAHFDANYVPEYSRIYLSKKDGRYTEADLVTIAEGQIAAEDKATGNAADLVICDTSLEVIKIWSEWKFGRCAPFIAQQAHARLPQLFLLLYPDIPWEPDPLRENPENREELFALYQKMLQRYPCPTKEIKGPENTRLSQAITAIDALIIAH